jgi:hypothetical protein
VTKRARLILETAFALAIGTLAGCGYATRGLYSPDIETVSVPIFQSTGFRRDVEIQLTEKVVKAIEAQTPFKVVQSGGDTELRGKIINYFKAPFGEDGADNPRGGLMMMNLSLTWVDNRSGGVIKETTQSFTIDNNGSYVIDLGQSQATAQEKIYDEMADYVVSMMQAPW